MRKSLPLLIEHARTARDQAAGRNEAALAAVRESDATVERLEQYRLEYLSAAPGTTGNSVSALSLASFHDFVARLDMAIGLQKHESKKRSSLAAQATQLLMEKQQRLFAFEALMARNNAAIQQVAARKEQSNSDEFAARLFRSNASGVSQ